MPVEKTFSSAHMWEHSNKTMCKQAQLDPYEHLLTNWDRQMAKQIPLRMFFNAIAMGAASLFYLSRFNEINRLKRLKFSVDMIINVSTRALLAGVVADVCTRKLFVNYDRITHHKVAQNEIKKIMRTMPNARPLLKPH